jgi:hypothetical protein
MVPKPSGGKVLSGGQAVALSSRLSAARLIGRLLRRFLAWALWLVCLYAWFSDVVIHAWHGQYTDLVVLLLLIPFFLLIYFSEGIEIAVTDLKDKEAAQLGDASMRTLLIAIKSRLDFFVAQQQTLALFVVTLASTIAALGFKKLDVYPFGEIASPFAVGAINFVAISVTILCLCQVPAKRLALINSERFLAQAKLLWPFIRLVGLLDLPAPSEPIIAGMRKMFRFPDRRLPPGRSAHYSTSALIYGYCLDQYAVSIELRADGSADVSRHFLVVFLHGSRKTVTGRMRAGEVDHRIATRVDLMECWRMPAVEDLGTYSSILDEVFDASRNGRPVVPILLQHHLAPIEDIQLHSQSTIVADLPKTYDWVIRFLEGLPEHHNDPSAPTDHMVCLLYRVTGIAPAGSFTVGNSSDYWTEEIGTVSRKLHFTVTSGAPELAVAVQSCNVGLENTQTELATEAIGCLPTLKARGFIAFPIQSAVYKFNWDTLLV